MKIPYYQDTLSHVCPSTAYLDDEPLADMSYVGTDKYTDFPVHVKWNDSAQRWYLVCRRTFQFVPPLHETFVEVDERPDCLCKRSES